MEHIDVTSTQLESIASTSTHSPQSTNTSPSQISPQQHLSRLANSYSAAMPNIQSMLPNPLASADPSFSSLTSGFSPLGLLQPMGTSMPPTYSDPLAVMSALQSASLGFNSSIDTHQYSSASHWINALSSRKRKHAPKTTATTSEPSGMISPEQDKKPAKLSQPTSTSSGEKKDESYWDRRRKNNEAAKRSRDARRMKEDEVIKRASFLEQENTALRAQMKILRHEFTRLQFLVYSWASSGAASAPSQPPASLPSSLLPDKSLDSETNQASV